MLALLLQDIVERFQLLLVLCFVVVEDISNSGTWWPATGTLLECGRIFLWEVGPAHSSWQQLAAAGRLLSGPSVDSCQKRAGTCFT